MLSEAYGDYIPSICEYWFRRYNKSDFNMEDKERSSQPKKFEDEKWKLYSIKTRVKRKKNLQNH